MTRSLSMDARELMSVWFALGAASSVEVGGEDGQDALTSRGQAAIIELVALGFVTVVAIGERGRLQFSGTAHVGRLGVKMTPAEMAQRPIWRATAPNPARATIARPIAEAPIEGEFFAPNPHGDLIRVQRYDFGSAFVGRDAVICLRTGKWWTPLWFVPELVTPIPDVNVSAPTSIDAEFNWQYADAVMAQVRAALEEYDAKRKL